jgi:DNA-binding CsgD family transcriptional regulator
MLSRLDATKLRWGLRELYTDLAEQVATLFPSAYATFFLWPSGAATVPLLPAEATQHVPWWTPARALDLLLMTAADERATHGIVTWDVLDEMFPAIFDKLRSSPDGIGSFMRLGLPCATGNRVSCWMTRPPETPEFTAGDALSFAELAPQLRDVVDFQQSIEDSELLRTLVQTLHSMLAPAMIVSASGRPLFKNDAGKACLSAHEATAQQGGTWLPISAGNARWNLYLGDFLLVAPGDAWHTPWAQRWSLSPRHAATAVYVARGLVDKEIASLMGLQVSTVRTYVAQLLKNAGIKTRSGLLWSILTPSDIKPKRE